MARMSSFENILALDTALGGCSAALVAGERRAVRLEVMARGQAEVLVPFVEEVMGELGLAYADLGAVVCTVGPGAFTGLRMGLSTARAFGLSLGIPVFGVTTFDALAQDFCSREGKSCSVILETKRKDFYFQHFDKTGLSVSEGAAAEELEVPAGNVLIGDGAVRFAGENEGCGDVEEGYGLPDMGFVARLLQEQGSGGRIFIAEAEPVYLRGADVSQPKVPLRKLQV